MDSPLESYEGSICQSLSFDGGISFNLEDKQNYPSSYGHQNGILSDSPLHQLQENQKNSNKVLAFTASTSESTHNKLKYINPCEDVACLETDYQQCRETVDQPSRQSNLTKRKPSEEKQERPVKAKKIEKEKIGKEKRTKVYKKQQEALKKHDNNRFGLHFTKATDEGVTIIYKVLCGEELDLAGLRELSLYQQERSTDIFLLRLDDEAVKRVLRSESASERFTQDDLLDPSCIIVQEKKGFYYTCYEACKKIINTDLKKLLTETGLENLSSESPQPSSVDNVNKTASSYPEGQSSLKCWDTDKIENFLKKWFNEKLNDMVDEK